MSRTRFAANSFSFDVVEGKVPVPASSISTKELPGLPDGLAADEEGLVWVAFYRGGCVARFAPNGDLARRIDIPALKPLSVCFGGADGSDLYVVTGKSEPGADDTGSIFRIRPGVRGAPVGVACI